MNQTKFAVKCKECGDLNEVEEMLDFGDKCVTCCMVELEATGEIVQ